MSKHTRIEFGKYDGLSIKFEGKKQIQNRITIAESLITGDKKKSGALKSADNLNKTQMKCKRTNDDDRQ